MRQTVGRTLPLLLLFGLIGGVGVGLAAGEGFPLELLRAADPIWLGVAVALAFVPWIGDTVRLRIWSTALGYPLAAGRALRVVVGTEVGSALTPTAVGGLPVKVALLAREGVPAPVGMSLAGVKAVEDAIFFAVFLPLALAWMGPGPLAHVREIVSEIVAPLRESPGGTPSAVVILWLLGLGILIVLLGLGVARLLRDPRATGSRLRLPRIRTFRVTARLRASGWRGHLMTSLQLGRKIAGRRLAMSFGWTAIQWSCRYSALTALAMGLGLSVDPVLFWFLQWFLFTAMTLIPTPGGSGGAEVAFALVYGPLLPSATVGWLVVGWRLVTFHLLLAAGALTFFLLRGRSGGSV